LFRAGAAERAEARRRDERLGRLRAHENPLVQAAATHVHSGELTLDEAESVASGAALDDVLEQARLRRAAERAQPAGFWG
jgi:hypothetical protein